MFTTYRIEDDPKESAWLASFIAKLMSYELGIQVNPEEITWETCTDTYSIYTARVERENKIYSVAVKMQFGALSCISKEVSDVTTDIAMPTEEESGEGEKDDTTEVRMTIFQIREHYGKDIAAECEKMKDAEIREFYTSTYMAIRVRCEETFWMKVYYVSGENIVEEALTEEVEEDMGMDF